MKSQVESKKLGKFGTGLLGLTAITALGGGLGGLKNGYSSGDFAKTNEFNGTIHSYAWEDFGDDTLSGKVKPALSVAAIPYSASAYVGNTIGILGNRIFGEMPSFENTTDQHYSWK